MPQLERVDQLPLPNLNLYAGLSGLTLFYTVMYAFTSSQNGFVSMVWSDVWCCAAVLNMCCCCFFLLTKFIYSFIFGKLQNVEHQHMRDKFWNFVFYKFIFVFGVMNVQEIPEMLCWCVWFAVLGTLLLTEQLCKDRFQFLSFSPNTPTSSHAKIILLLSFVLLSCAGLFMVCAIVGWQYGFNHFTFLYSEVFILFARTLHSIIKHIIHLWDMHHDGVWENRSTYIYYIELVLEVSVLGVDFMHHIHMLLWANMFLSVASLILLMKLRFLYQEIQRRLKRHNNYILVSETLENRFELVSSHDLLLSDETCAICWEKMRTACRLPCGHLFHRVCLRAWLEQDTVCPTCRLSLSEDLRRGREVNEARDNGGQEAGPDGSSDAPPTPNGGGATAQTGRRRRLGGNNNMNWLLRFNGASIASWLPTFSLELHQEDDMRWVGDAAELHRVAQQLHSMFPHVPLQAITLDLADTHSVSLTVDHILNNTIYIPVQQGGVAEDTLLLTADEATPLLPADTTTIVDTHLPTGLESATSSDPTPSPSHTPSPPTTSPIMASKESHDLSSDFELHAQQPSNSPDMQESRETRDRSAQSLSLPTLRLRRHPATGGSEGEKEKGEEGEEEEEEEKEGEEELMEGRSIRVAKAIESTGTSYSELFGSLQERKAELLRRAKRAYLMKEDS